jgi:molecular chaperone HscB
MRLDSDDFELFGLPRRFALGRPDIDSRWKALQAEVHPDRFAAHGGSAQRLAMQWAVRVNEAYQRLKDPLRRAAYLCELAGAPIEAESNTAMPGDFLMQQMEWREALDDADDVPAVEQLAATVDQARSERLAHVERLLDRDRNAIAAAREVRALMFIERFADDIDRRLEALGQ